MPQILHPLLNYLDHPIVALLYFVPIFLVIDPFIYFFFKRKNPPKYHGSARDMGEQFFHLADTSIKDMLEGDQIRLERLDMAALDKKLVHSELYIMHLFVISRTIQGIIKGKVLVREVTNEMINFFYPKLITQLGFTLEQLDREQRHLFERFREYNELLENIPKYWILPMATRTVENIRGKDNDNYKAIDSMISEISLLLNQIPLVFERMHCKHTPVEPEYFKLPPRKEMFGEKDTYIS